MSVDGAQAGPEVDSGCTLVPPGIIHMAGPDVREEDIAFVLDALRTGWYGPGAYHYVERFEREFAAFHGRAFGLMTPSCTTAIHLVLEGLGVGDGDDVLVPESTWVGSSAGVRHCGAREVFVDVEEDTWCVGANSLEAGRTGSTAAGIVVDLYGNMPDWDAIESWSDERGIPVIEDAAEALGSEYRGLRAGKFGVASVFSFHRTKTLTTGEGGILLTDDETLYERCRFLRDHGRAPGSYFNTEVAFKYMPSNLMASLAYGQFRRIDELIGKKRHDYEMFRALLDGLAELSVNPEPPGVVNGAWATGVVFTRESRLSGEAAMDALAKRGVPTRPFFYPLSSLPAYDGNGTGGPERNPVAYSLHARGIHLPCAMDMTDAQVEYISTAIRDFVKERARSRALA